MLPGDLVPPLGLSIICSVLSHNGSRHLTTILPDLKRRLCSVMATLDPLSSVVSSAPRSSAPPFLTSASVAFPPHSAVLPCTVSTPSPQPRPLMFVCVNCEKLTFSSALTCAHCGDGTVQCLRSSTTPCPIIPETCRAEHSLCLPAGSLTGLPLFYVVAVVHVLLDWIAALVVKSRRYSRGAAISPPFLINGEVIVWIVEDPIWVSHPILRPGSVFFYEPSAGHYRLSSIELVTLLQRIQSGVVLSGPICRSCLRLAASSAEVPWVSILLRDNISITGDLCCFMPLSTPITQELASRSVTRFGPIILSGVVPTSLRRQKFCTPVLPPSVSRPCLDASPPVANPIVTADPASPASFSVLSLNCGGISGKIDNVAALVCWLDPDVVCLQELWDAFEPTDLEFPTYTLFCCGPRLRGGGLATLVHTRVLPTSSARAIELNVQHAQMVRFTLSTGVRFVLLNVYLNPSISPEDWMIARQFVADVLRPRDAPIIVACGDMNEDLGRDRGRVASAMRTGHSWSPLFCPYTLGAPTNIVSRLGHVSSREIDYLLLHRASPIARVVKLLYPGVSTHRALYCVLELSPGCPLPHGSTRSMHYQAASAESIQQLSAHTSLCLWMGAISSLHVDLIFQRYHHLAHQLIPFRGSQASAAEAVLLQNLEIRASSGDAVARGRLDKWLEDAKDRAFRLRLGLQKQLLAEAQVSSLTSKIFFQANAASFAWSSASARMVFISPASEPSSFTKPMFRRKSSTVCVVSVFTSTSCVLRHLPAMFSTLTILHCRFLFSPA